MYEQVRSYFMRPIVGAYQGVVKVSTGDVKTEKLFAGVR